MQNQYLKKDKHKIKSDMLKLHNKTFLMAATSFARFIEFVKLCFLSSVYYNIFGINKAEQCSQLPLIKFPTEVRTGQNSFVIVVDHIGRPATITCNNASL